MTLPLVLTRNQVREFDRIAIESFGMNSLVLMENAARGVTDALCEFNGQQPGSAVVVCGPGNNGGDGLAVARHLHVRGWAVRAILLASPEKISEDSLANLRILRRTSVEIAEMDLSDDETFSEAEFRGRVGRVDWIIDAVLGTGARPPLRAPLDQIVTICNELPCRRMAIDIPTGLDCDAGEGSPGREQVAFRADLTVTFVALKPVMVTEAGKAYLGTIKIVDIGAPPEALDQIPY